ncbi:hypothetical protein HNV26_21985, partial [Myxococcus xanthus]|nr:hypothetical protein [Myxococcus xanthus]
RRYQYPGASDLYKRQSDESEPTDRTVVIQLPTAKEDDDWTALVDELDK